MNRITVAASSLALLGVLACDGGNDSVGPDLPAFVPNDQSACVIPNDEIFDGGPGKDGIPALTDPHMVRADHPDAEWIDLDDRVIGVVYDGRAIAIPHTLGWGHEIMNMSHPVMLSVTYCPLTGSSMVFDREALHGAELGVSGLLYRTNLIMYNRSTPEALWSQMGRSAVCGTSRGTPLPMLAAFEMNWEGWKTLHPETLVPAHNLSIGQLFGFYRYPYGDYETNGAIFFPFPEEDFRRPLKERVLGIPASEISLPTTSGEPGRTAMAFPFGALDATGPVTVAEANLGDGPVVVFWNRAWQGAAAFHAELDGQRMDFLVEGGKVRDMATGSSWRLDGLADGGPLAGRSLTPVADAYVAFWFAWAEFNQGTEVWTTGG